MPVDIAYFAHGTTEDNERGVSSGWFDAELSELGRRQAIKLAPSLRHRRFDVIFCSDLRRATDTAKLIFGNRVRIVQDKRLRECNYGDLTKEETSRIDELMPDHIDRPFPNGESYKDVERRIRSFLIDVHDEYHGKHVAIVAHRAPQLALDVLLKGKTWKQAIQEDWRNKKEWQPGWKYRYEGTRGL